MKDKAMKRNVRVTLDTLALAKVSLLNAVNFRDPDIVLLQLGGCFLVVRSQSLAVTTPIRVR